MNSRSGSCSLLSLALAGCAIGGRVHGGVLADRDGVEPFAGVTATFALLDGRSYVGL
ncbi:MAG: hypothetical protein NT062_38650 [Proteobacteria bacterium]|nr:hypothetical protein [Pseudomonadota bacterium]